MFWEEKDVTNLLLLIPEMNTELQRINNEVDELEDAMRELKTPTGAVFGKKSPGGVMFHCQRKDVLKETQLKLVEMIEKRDFLREKLKLSIAKQKEKIKAVAESKKQQEAAT